MWTINTDPVTLYGSTYTLCILKEQCFCLLQDAFSHHMIHPLFTWHIYSWYDAFTYPMHPVIIFRFDCFFFIYLCWRFCKCLGSMNYNIFKIFVFFCIYCKGWLGIDNHLQKRRHILQKGRSSSSETRAKPRMSPTGLATLQTEDSNTPEYRTVICQF